MLEYSYPFSAFPQVMQDAIAEAERRTRAPRPLIAGTALAAAALACQATRRVQRPNTSPCPLSLFIGSVADSGERKTTNDRLFYRPFKELVKEFEVEYEKHRHRAEASLHAWKIQWREAEKKIRKKISQEGVQDDGAELAALLAAKPVFPRKPVLIYNDVTPEALLAGLHNNMPSAVLQFDEGARLLDSRVGRSFYLLNSLWDGSPQSVERRTQESFTVDGVSLTISLMIQPKAFRRFFEKNGVEAEESGFLARFLMAMPMSRQGYRTEDISTPIPLDAEEKEDSAMAKFGELLKSILRKDMDVMRSGRVDEFEILTFSGQARQMWREFNNEIEMRLAPLEGMPGVRAACAKMGEQVARIAAIFHCIERREGLIIDNYTLERAIHVGRWYLNEYQRIFGQNGQMTVRGDAVLLCARLDEWVSRAFSESGAQTIEIPLAELYKKAPSSIRRKERLMPAIKYANAEGWICYAPLPKPGHVSIQYSVPRSPRPWALSTEGSLTSMLSITI